MADRPTQVPEWATGEDADIVEPPAGKKEQGWVQGEKPPAGYFNWLFSQLTRWIAWFAQEIKGRQEGGISVPGGIETSSLSVLGAIETRSLEADGGPGATKPAVYGRGRGSNAPGGMFEGSSPLRVSADSGDSPVVFGERKGSATGPVFAAVHNASTTPERGLYHIGSCPPPTNPVEGDVYRNPAGRVFYFDGSRWLPIVLPSSVTRRHVVGEPGEPSLGSGYTIAPGGGLYMPSFYFDGRRVWLDGYVQHIANQPLEIFNLTVQLQAFWPDHDVFFYGTVVGKPAACVVVTTQGIVTVQGVSQDEIFNVSLAGLSFEVAEW